MKRVLLLLFGAGVVASHAQSPGGVSGTDLWYKTVPVTGDLQGSYRWRDFAGDTVKLRQYDRLGTGYGDEFTQPRSSLHVFNFHPALDLPANALGKAAQLRYSNLPQATVIGVFAPKLSGHAADMLLYGINGRPGDGALFSKDKVVRRMGTEALDYGSETGEDLLYSSSDSLPEEELKESLLRVATYFKADRPDHSVWGERQNTAITMGTDYLPADPNYTTAFDTGLFGNGSFDGYSSEFIVYDRFLTPLERRRVESYLAVRHGITLKGSYFDSGGNLLWDRDGNTAYHHRVTGIARDGAGSLDQPLSTTSYEEAPNFSVETANDAYYERNSYNLSTSNRLLVMGREQANAMPEGSYLIWGDNDAPLATYQPEEDSPWHIMNRRWLANTNMDSLGYASAWTGSGIAVTSDGFTDRLFQSAASEGAYARTPALPGEEGCLEFRYPAAGPAFDAGFATGGETVCRYGYRFTPSGDIYLIVNDTVQAQPAVTDAVGSRITIRKTADALYLRIGNTGSHAYTVPLPEASSDRAYSAIVRVQSSEAPLDIASLRCGGFADTGNRIELAYDLTEQAEFRPYRLKRTVLLVDPEGESITNPEELHMVTCSGYDAQRGKTLFRNVFWDTDKNGKDLFTFAYFDGIMAGFTPYPTTCLDGMPQADGSIGIDITMGSPLYEYTLRADSVSGYEPDSLVRHGYFTSDRYEIDSLMTGVYTLELKQKDGTNLYASVPTAEQDAYASSERVYRSGTFTWVVADTLSNYRAGIEHKEDFGEKIEFGFEVIGDKAYPIVKEDTKDDRYVQIKEGDVLSFRFDKTGIYYMVNDSVIHSAGKIADHDWGFCADFTAGDSRMYNITVDGEACRFPYATDYVVADEFTSRTIRRTVKIGNGCDGSVPNEVIEEAQSSWKDPVTGIEENTVTDNAGAFRVYPEKEGSRRFAAELALARPDRATLIIFDAAGRLQEEMPFAGDKDKKARFTLPAPGVYVVKALTPEDEYTQKIIVK